MGKTKKRKYGKIKSEQFDTKWNECFSKIHQLLPVENMEPLSNEEGMQCFSELQTMKDELNYTKNLLNNINIVKWNKHTKWMHLCSNIITILSRYINAELVTQAWAKFYTILNTFDFFTSIDLHYVNTVHLCEAPGSFVTSLNHYLRSYYGNKIRWNWFATTLNPYHEGNDTCQMIDDDRFIIETLSHWEFGPDFTGNIMNAENLYHLEEKFKDVFVSLVTADGSTDCSENPGEQENLVAMLLLWETITALKILSDGGSFVLKIFTIFEKFTISLMYLLHSLFQDMTFIKPGPSKPGNSEVYVVCESFSKENYLKSTIFHKFIDAAINKNIVEADITDTIPKSFMHDIMMYAKNSTQRQIQVINKNLASFKNDPKPTDELKEVKDYISKRFLKEFSVYPIEDYVAPLFVLKTKDGLIYNRNTSFTFKRGSYNQRLEKNQNQGTSTDLPKVLHDNKEDVLLLETSDDINEGLHEIMFTPDHTCCCLESINNFKFILGKNDTGINSSCFIPSALLKKYFESKQKHGAVLTNTAMSYHFELNKLHQIYPTIGILQKKSMLFISYSNDATNLVSYFHEKGIFADHKTPRSDHSSDEDKDGEDEDETSLLDNQVKYNLITCDFGNINVVPKEKNLNIIKEVFLHMKSSQTLLFRLEGLVFPSFWHGMFFLLSGLFMKMMFVKSEWTKDLYYLIYIDCNATSELIDILTVYVQKLRDELLQLQDDVDIFHVVDIYSLMQSNYRKYTIQRNELFGQDFLKAVSKLL